MNAMFNCEREDWTLEETSIEALATSMGDTVVFISPRRQAVRTLAYHRCVR